MAQSIQMCVPWQSLIRQWINKRPAPYIHLPMLKQLQWFKLVKRVNFGLQVEKMWILAVIVFEKKKKKSAASFFYTNRIKTRCQVKKHQADLIMTEWYNFKIPIKKKEMQDATRTFAISARFRGFSSDLNSDLDLVTKPCDQSMLSKQFRTMSIKFP